MTNEQYEKFIEMNRDLRTENIEAADGDQGKILDAINDFHTIIQVVTERKVDEDMGEIPY